MLPPEVETHFREKSSKINDLEIKYGKVYEDNLLKAFFIEVIFSLQRTTMCAVSILMCLSTQSLFITERWS